MAVSQVLWEIGRGGGEVSCARGLRDHDVFGDGDDDHSCLESGSECGSLGVVHYDCDCDCDREYDLCLPSAVTLSECEMLCGGDGRGCRSQVRQNRKS